MDQDRARGCVDQDECVVIRKRRVSKKNKDMIIAGLVLTVAVVYALAPYISRSVLLYRRQAAQEHVEKVETQQNRVTPN